MSQNIVFLAENNENNVKIGNVLCKEGVSIAGYWLGSSGVEYSKIESTCGSLLTSPVEESFKTFISAFLWDLGYRPDVLIIKGRLFEMWGLASLVREGVFDFPCVAVIDTPIVPLSGFDIMMLDQFDKTFVLKGEGFGRLVEYLNIVKEEKVEKILKNIIEKIEPMQEFEGFFDKSIKEEEMQNFVEEIKGKVLNINKGKTVSGAVIN